MSKSTPRRTSAHTVFVCESCGAQTGKWLGRCADCGAWNAMKEEQVRPVSTDADVTRYGLGAAHGRSTARAYADVDLVAPQRIASGFDEFDRVLGGAGCVGEARSWL